MLRERAFSGRESSDRHFRWRSHEPSRIEGLSDAVFAFAITLLVVSLEVPKTFAELLEVMSGFAGFAVSFAMLAYIWHAQYMFFRRYGLDDGLTVLLNLLLLFLVLFFVYPLKFLTAAITNVVTGHGLQVAAGTNGALVPMLQPPDWLTLMAIYSAGFAGVFTIITLLYTRAYRFRVPLELTQVETIETRFSVIEAALQAAIGMVVLVAILTTRQFWAPLLYLAITPAQLLQGRARHRARARLERSASEPVTAG